MAELDIKLTGEQLTALGPTAEHRQQFGQSFLGSIIGQAIVLVGMIVAYFAAVALLFHYASEDLKGLHETLGNFWFWLAIAFPFAVILLFSMLPTGLRALRDQRNKARAIGGAAQIAPGYFRLYPYGAVDRPQFVRRDGMDEVVLKWLQATSNSILYLSGASGSGKSSLLSASVLPKLRDMNWAIIETRAFGDPIEKLRNELAGRAASKPDSLRDLLASAAKIQAQKKSAGPLLIVIDQFEEFLILQTPEQQRPLANLLKDLSQNPIQGLKLLLVFRSDYRPLIFKLELPPLAAGSNWQEVGAYSRGEAEAFLQGGGRTFSQQNLDSLFRGLDGIEDAKQMYRLVTLNMVGLILENMGRDFTDDAARLIQSYLRDCLKSRDIQDYAKPVLNAMISDAGTKEPRSETELSKLTGLALWQVNTALAGLSQQGLVRRLDGNEPVWEIAHDFIARMLGQLMGRMRPTIWHRIQPVLATNDTSKLDRSGRNQHTLLAKF